MSTRTLIAGIGNIFLGDDAFGVEVLKLADWTPPAGVKVVDFGIRGLDLAYALTDGYDTAVLVDCTPRGGTPGTLYALEVAWDEVAGARQDGAPIEMHHLDPWRVLQLVASLGGRIEKLLVVGCEPSADDTYDMHMGMSPAVAAATDEAAEMVKSLAQKLSDEQSSAVEEALQDNR